MHPIRDSQPCHGKELQMSLQPNTISQTQENTLDKLVQECLPCMLHVTCSQASFFFHCRMCLRQLSAPLPCKSLLEPVCRSTCKADLSSHLGCSRLSQCCFLTCKLLACPLGRLQRGVSAVTKSGFIPGESGGKTMILALFPPSRKSIHMLASVFAFRISLIHTPLFQLGVQIP